MVCLLYKKTANALIFAVKHSNTILTVRINIKMFLKIFKYFIEVHANDGVVVSKTTSVIQQSILVSYFNVCLIFAYKVDKLNSLLNKKIEPS